MKDRSKVTVYIVNHNYGRYVEKAIQSVLTQTYQNIEILIFDDGSTDESISVIEAYATNPKITCVFQENRGLLATNNIAISRSTGDYIIRLDADDYFEEHALELLAGYLDRHPEKAMVFPDYFLVDKTGGVVDVVRRHNFDQVTQLDQPAHGACTMTRRSALVTLNGYDEAFRCQDGWDMAQANSEIWNREYQPTAFFYRQHGESITRNEEQLLSTRSRILKKNLNVTATHQPRGVALIPVRGPEIDPNSSALLPLGDKLVIDWTIDAALGSEYVQEVVISCPDKKVKDHLHSRYGDEVFVVDRDLKLAMVNKPIDDSLTDAFNALPPEKNNFDVVVLLYCEAPFRTSTQIDTAIDALKVFDAKGVIAVRRQAQAFFYHSGEGMTPIRQSKSLITNERDIIYEAVGGLIVLQRKTFYRDIFNADRIGHIELDEQSALSINSKWTYEIAKMNAENLLVSV